MKKIISILLMMLMMVMLMFGCVSRNDYDVLMAEYDTVCATLESSQSEIQTLQSDLAAECSESARLESDLASTQATNSELTANLEKSQTELESAEDKVVELTSGLEKSQSELSAAKSEYEAFKSDMQSLWSPLGGHLLINQTILGITAGLLLDDLDEVEKQCNLMTGRLTAFGDPELQALWEESYVVEGGQWNLFFGPFERFMAANDARIGSKARALRTKLGV